MTRPRQHSDEQPQSVAVGGREVPIDTYARMIDAFLADHPDFQPPPRPGIRGSMSRLGLRGLPTDWWKPYEHLIGGDRAEAAIGDGDVSADDDLGDLRREVSVLAAQIAAIQATQVEQNNMLRQILGKLG